jgi:uncharacterized membrane protein
MQNPPPVQTAPAKSSTGLDENVAALLSYVVGWISGLVFFLIEKDSRLVRFHAMQSILLNVAALVLGVAFAILAGISTGVIAYFSAGLGFLVWILMVLVGSVIGLILVIAAIICIVKAYQGQYFKLPVVGNFAEKFSTK